MCPIHAAHGVNDFDPFFLTTQNLFTVRTPQTNWIRPEGRPVRPQGHSANFFTVSEKV